ncbi:MAG: TPM domain-containing protein [Deltaproteobacteria bacterium]|nr:TPM domain-containing protein [Deltaproteobacteria bacterium]
MRRRSAGVLAVALALALAAGALALQVPPAPLGRVSDFAGLLSPADKARLESRLEAIEAASSNQFAVAIFKSLEGDSLEDFSIRLGDAWKVGHKGRDNGLLLLVFTEDRKIRIEVGKGLEGVIPDALASRVIRNELAPRFRQGDFTGGLLAAVDALDAASRGEYQPLPESGGKRVTGPIAGIAPFLIFLVIWAIAGRLNRATHLGGRGVQGSSLWWLWFLGGFGGGRGGGGWGSGGGGGFGGGGFSGGGGGFGGGGSSGSW